MRNPVGACLRQDPRGRHVQKLAGLLGVEQAHAAPKSDG
jgi:hypothetical protein